MNELEVIERAEYILLQVLRCVPMDGHSYLYEIDLDSVSQAVIALEAAGLLVKEVH